MLLFALSALGCRSSGTFTWYHALSPADFAPIASEYRIGVGDTIDVRVFDQANLSMQGKIRSDGRIAIPFVGEVQAAGKPPAVFARELEQRLKEFIVSPRVTVNVVDAVPVTVSVLGEVGSRGTLTLAPPATLVQALAQAGGPSEFADEDSIYVLRKTPSFRRIRFTYDALIKNLGGAATFPLQSGDVVVVQ